MVSVGVCVGVCAVAFSTFFLSFLPNFLTLNSVILCIVLKKAIYAIDIGDWSFRIHLTVNLTYFS